MTDGSLPTNAYSPRPSPDDGDSRGELDDDSFLSPRRLPPKARMKRNMAGHASSAQAALENSAAAAAASASTMPWSPALSATRSHSADPYSTTTMATPPPPTASTAGSTQRRLSVLDAAEALAGLGVRSPAATAPSLSSGRASEPLSSGSYGEPLSSSSRDGRELMRVPPSLRPPPIVAEASPRVREAWAPSPPPLMLSRQREAAGAEGSYEAFGEERSVVLRNGIEHRPGDGSRPLESLIGSDVPLTFPQKLMEVLSNPDIASVISWLPHGRGFVILQKRRFAQEVMPLYFKQSKFTSFTRKLNRWGFARIARGPEMGAYYQKLFQRGNYLLCMQMHCQSNNKITKDAAAAPSSPATSPKPHDAETSSAASPKPDDADAEASSTPPPLAETLPDATNLDAESSGTPPPRSSPSPVAAPSNDMNVDDDAPDLQRISSPSSALSSPRLRSPEISNTTAVDGNNTLSSFASLAAAAGHGGTLARFNHQERGQRHQFGIGASSSASPGPRHHSPEISNANAVDGNSASPFASPAAGHGGTLARFGQRRQDQRRQFGTRSSANFTAAARQPTPAAGQGRSLAWFDPHGINFGRQREILRGTSTSSPMEVDENRGQGGLARQQRPRGSGNPGPFDRAFSRQQEILRGANLTLNAHREQGGPAMRPLSIAQQQQQPQWARSRQGGPTMQSYSMQQQQLNHGRPPRGRSNVDQAIAVQNLLGVDTSSSRNHPLVIANAMRALESSNDPALLSMLLSKKRAEAASPRGESSRQALYGQARGPSRSAMQAQLRRLEEQVTQRSSALAAERAPCAAPAAEDAHSAMLRQMIRLDKELKAQRAVLDAGEEAKGKTAAVGKAGGGAMSQGDVARLREIYARRRQDSAGASVDVSNDAPGPGGDGERRPERKYPRSVRRASAA